MLIYFSLNKLGQLDGGRVAEAFAQAMKRVVLDCEDRPGDDKARKVILQGEITPIVGQGGVCEGVNIEFQIQDKLPTRKSRSYAMGVKSGGKIFFSTGDPLNVDQFTFDEVNPETGRVEREGPEEPDATPMVDLDPQTIPSDLAGVPDEEGVALGPDDTEEDEELDDEYSTEPQGDAE